MLKNLNKKAISPVVATALLLVVAVVAVVGFQGWFQDFSSSVMSKVETQGDIASSGSITIDSLEGGDLYVVNNIMDNLSINKIKIGDIECNISGQENLSLGMNIIDVNECINGTSTSIKTIKILTNTKLIEKSVYVDTGTSGTTSSPSYSDCLLDGVNVNHGDSIVAYNSSSGSVCYSQTRTCNDDGTLNGSSDYNYSTCAVLSSSLTCMTDTDGDGQISWTCANYPMTNTTYEGDLDPDDTNINVVNDKCWLKDDKSSCEANLIVDGCGSGTVLDVGTGLCWQRNMSSYLDYDGTTLTWEQGKTYCSNLNLGGHTDWRLPKRQELFTIDDLSRSSYTVIGGNNNKFTNVIDGYYWTITTYGPTTTHAWVVYFGGGYGSDYDKTNDNYVLCVR